MTDPNREKLFPNPFYVLLLVASTLFVFTVLGDLVSAFVQDPAQAGAAVGPRADRRSSALAAWFDRYGSLALGVEVVVMIASGLLAMATDRWFSPRPARKGTGN